MMGLGKENVLHRWSVVYGSLATLVVVAAGIFLGIPLTLSALVALALIVAAILMHHNAVPLLCSLTAAVSILPLPVALPVSFSVAGGTIFATDILVLILGALLVPRIMVFPKAVQCLLTILIAAVCWASAVGLVRGATLGDVASDCRGLVYTVVIGLGVAYGLIGDYSGSKHIFVNLCSVIAIYTAVVVFAEMVFESGFFAIRADAAVLYTAAPNASAADALRLVPVSGLFCVLLAGALIGLWASERVSSASYKLLWPTVLSGLFIGVQGFSRNNLVALIVIVCVALLLNMRTHVLLKFCTGAIAFTGVSILAWMALGRISPAGKSLVDRSVTAFNERVLGGLDPSVISEDYSSRWRFTESSAGLASIGKDPYGTGFGIPYRGWLPGDPFTSDYGYTYLHNAYLWIPVKIGVPAAAVLAVAVSYLIIKFFATRNKTNRSVYTIIVAAGVAVAAVMVVSPLPFSRGDAMLCAGLVGLFTWTIHCSQDLGPVESRHESNKISADLRSAVPIRADGSVNDRARRV